MKKNYRLSLDCLLKKFISFDLFSLNLSLSVNEL